MQHASIKFVMHIVKLHEKLAKNKKNVNIIREKKISLKNKSYKELIRVVATSDFTKKKKALRVH